MRLLACLIVAPQRGYDEPAILSYAISSFCPTSADGLQPRHARGLLFLFVYRRVPNRQQAHALVSWSRRARQDRVVASPGPSRLSPGGSGRLDDRLLGRLTLQTEQKYPVLLEY